MSKNGINKDKFQSNRQQVKVTKCMYDDILTETKLKNSRKEQKVSTPNA